MDPAKSAEVIAPQPGAAGSVAPVELARATCNRHLAGAEMPSDLTVDARHSVRAIWVPREAAAGDERVTMRVPAIKARGVASERMPGSVVATNDRGRAIPMRVG